MTACIRSGHSTDCNYLCTCILLLRCHFSVFYCFGRSRDKEREKQKEKERERKKKGLPPNRDENVISKWCFELNLSFLIHMICMFSINLDNICMSCLMRKPAFWVCKNKGADQLWFQFLYA